MSSQVRELMPRAQYVRVLRSELPDEVFRRATSRILWVPLHLAIIVTAICAIAAGWFPWFVTPVLSLVIGACFAGLTFVAHEALHGAIVKNKQLQYLVGWIGFLLFTHSPRLWMAWHNAEHHARANFADDPDAYPTIGEYHASPLIRFTIDGYAPGAGRWRGFLTLLIGFTGQSTIQLIRARRQGLMSAAQHRRAILETLLDLAIWAVIGVLVGPLAFLFVFVIPLAVANVIVISFILTNHSLNQRVDINDPLASGLTVTTSRLVDFLTLGFGYHVEHHVFPAMSARHGEAVRALLQKHWPDRYHSMRFGEALLRLHRTARVYEDATTLLDPRTGAKHSTL